MLISFAKASAEAGYPFNPGLKCWETKQGHHLLVRFLSV